MPRSYTAGGTVKLNTDVRDILISIDLATPYGLISLVRDDGTAYEIRFADRK
jgi:hypothetical protein